MKLLVRRPRQVIETFRTAPKASRGTVRQVWSEIVRLQLTDSYKPYLRRGEITGIQIDKQLAEKTPTLWDIMIAQRGAMKDAEAAKRLQQLDRFDAYTKAAQYKASLDTQYGYSAIDGPWSVFFRTVKGDKVEDPVANIPDIVPNTYKVTKNEYHALTLAMLMVNVVVEELKMPEGAGGDPARAARAILDGYNDPQVAARVARYMKIGRLTLPGDKPSDFSSISDEPLAELIAKVGLRFAIRIKAGNAFAPDNAVNRLVRRYGSFHNSYSTRVKPEDSGNIRTLIQSACASFIESKKPAA